MMKYAILSVAAWAASTTTTTWAILPVVLVFLQSSVVHSEDVKSACQVCNSSSVAVATCFSDNGCSATDCSDASSSQCCPACSSEIQAALNCWVNCLPDCVSDTLVDYATCYTFSRCNNDCKATLLEKQSEIQGQVNNATETATGSTSSNYTINIDNVTAEDYSNAQVTIDFAVDQIPDGATCQTYEDYAVNYVCELGSCCSKCLTKLETVMECVVNDVISEVASSGNATDCTFTCSSSSRKLQSSPSSLPSGRPDLNQTALGNTAPELAPKMLSCVQGLAQSLAIDPSSALVSFVACIESSQGTFALQFKEVAAGGTGFTGSTTSSHSPPKVLPGLWIMIATFALPVVALLG